MSHQLTVLGTATLRIRRNLFVLPTQLRRHGAQHGGPLQLGGMQSAQRLELFALLAFGGSSDVGMGGFDRAAQTQQSIDGQRGVRFGLGDILDEPRAILVALRLEFRNERIAVGLLLAQMSEEFGASALLVELQTTR